ncbi:MAG: SufD family Fe-S cluster assembly protein, partial [Myxococcota bacterium]
QQQCSHHRFAVHHQAANCNSQQQHRGLYAGRAQGIFAGQVIVDKEAVGTQAHQLSRSLLLSPQAQAYSEPQLQIDTDDVQCGHGATVSQLDENALFYLQSRGIERYRAHCMLTEAFAQDALHNLQPAWLHGWLQQRVNRLLSAVASA